MKPSDLIAQANRLASASRGRPRQVDLKRALSGAYYAMFHALASECADAVVGAGRDRSEDAWTRVYRALDHGAVKNACNQVKSKGMPSTVANFAKLFAALQGERHAADYDPRSFFERSEVAGFIADADAAIVEFQALPRADRRAFVALVLFREPRR